LEKRIIEEREMRMTRAGDTVPWEVPLEGREPAGL
jgi:hypothetical protein